VAEYLFNLSSGDHAEASALLEAALWGVGDDEPHRDELAAGDLVLLYVASTEGAFIGRAELATPVHAWPPAEADSYPGGTSSGGVLPSSGVVLSHIERWDRAVPMAAVVRRVDPTGSNPLVQANARAGFPTGVVRITRDEYEAALSASREYQTA
jgi:hypothetical protein